MTRRNLLSSILLSLIALVVAVPTALANDGDLIWDASAQQGATTLKAKYKESPENGLLDQTLEVQLEDAPRGVTVFISINGQVIGDMTTDMTGRAEFRMDKFGVMPDGNGRPNGPRIETGDVIRVFRGNQGISASFVPRP